MAAALSLEDRITLQDLLLNYVWANDSADVEALVRLFTPDGIVQPSTGERFLVRPWAVSTFSHSGRRGRQHWVQPVSFLPDGEQCRVRSYWKVIQWVTASNTKSINAMGYYEDICIKIDGRWLIKEKLMYRCNDDSALPW